MSNGVFAGGTVDGNILPTQTGKDLGSAAQRWDVFAQDFNVAGTFSASGASRPYYDVKFYGAVGNGVTDDTTAIQLAIDTAKLDGGSSQLGATVFFPPGEYLISSPLLLPRTTSSPVNVVWLLGASMRCVRIRGSAAFPTGRALIEWESVLKQTWHQRIMNLNLLLPNVAATKAILYTPTLSSTYAQIVAETLSIDLENVLIEGSNQYHQNFILLHGRLIECNFDNVVGDPNIGASTFDTILIETDTTELLAVGDDGSGFFQSHFNHIIGTQRRGGAMQVFKGRFLRGTWNGGIAQATVNAKSYEFVNSLASDFFGLSTEGGGDKPAYYISGSRNLRFYEMGIGSASDRGSGVGNGIELVSTTDCEFHGRWSVTGTPSWTSVGNKFITVDANSHRNRFFGLLTNNTFANEITNSGNNNYFEGYDIAGATRQSLGTMGSGPHSPFTPATVHGDATNYWAYNGTIGVITARAGLFTTIGATGQVTSTLPTGTAPFSITSTTKTVNLNADLLDDATTATAGTASTVALRDASGQLTSKRFIVDGTALVAGDFALSANWGAGAAVSAVTGRDQGWNITVTAAGTPGASPTVILTFKDGTWVSSPLGISKMTGGTGAITNLTDSLTATAWTITFQGTPAAGSTYLITGLVIGR